MQLRASLPRYVVPGRDVRITTVDGSIHEFKVRTLTNDHVSGESSDGTEHHVEIATIAKVETRRFNPTKTIELGATIGAILLTVLFLLVGRTDR
jgi:hypothetical protein